MSEAEIPMTLRDWLAGQAMPAAIAEASTSSAVKDWDLNELFGRHASGLRREDIAAALAYRYADAMLRRRSGNLAR